MTWPGEATRHDVMRIDPAAVRAAAELLAAELRRLRADGVGGEPRFETATELPPGSFGGWDTGLALAESHDVARAATLRCLRRLIAELAVTVELLQVAAGEQSSNDAAVQAGFGAQEEGLDGGAAPTVVA